ncbi:MAG: hypothetical protein PVI44_13900 [Balneolaceae bacterium]|jgi:Tfp pilus assembly protein PilO
MSYGLRNTIILLVVLATFVVGGWSYLYFYQEPRVKKLETEVEKTRQELQSKQEKADQYPMLLKRYKKATNFFNNYNKALYATNNEDNVYDFLNTVSSGSAYTDFTFNFQDSTSQGKFGTMQMSITGEAYYRNFINFVRQIELSKPLNKIGGISVNPIDQLDSYGKVDFKFTLKSFYDRVKLLGKPDMVIKNDILASVYNPFFPLIRSVKTNEDNLINIEASKLLAVSGNKAFLLDQEGKMQTLRKGDEVYLGKLTSINLNKGAASFTLNKGGIIDRVTLQVNALQVNNDGNQSSN